MLPYRCQVPPLTTLRTWAGKVQEGEPLEGNATKSVLNRTKEETILNFIKELKYEATVIDLDTIAALGRLVAQRSLGTGLPPVLDRQWATKFRRRHKMKCLKKIKTEQPPSAVSDLALDNNWRREFLDLVEPQQYGVRIPGGVPQPLPPWAQLGLEVRGGYAAGQRQVRRYSSDDERHTRVTSVVNCEGTVIVVQVLHKGKQVAALRVSICLTACDPTCTKRTRRRTRRLATPFKRMMIKADTEVAKDRRDHYIQGVQQFHTHKI